MFKLCLPGDIPLFSIWVIPCSVIVLIAIHNRDKMMVSVVGFTALTCINADVAHKPILSAVATLEKAAISRKFKLRIVFFVFSGKRPVIARLKMPVVISNSNGISGPDKCVYFLFTVGIHNAFDFKKLFAIWQVKIRKITHAADF